LIPVLGYFGKAEVVNCMSSNQTGQLMINS